MQTTTSSIIRKVFAGFAGFLVWAISFTILQGLMIFFGNMGPERIGTQLVTGFTASLAACLIVAGPLIRKICPDSNGRIEWMTVLVIAFGFALLNMFLLFVLKIEVHLPAASIVALHISSFIPLVIAYTKGREWS